jgi:hypothetical protein
MVNNSLSLLIPLIGHEFDACVDHCLLVLMHDSNLHEARFSGLHSTIVEIKSRVCHKKMRTQMRTHFCPNLLNFAQK